MTASLPFQADAFQPTAFQTEESPYVYPNDLVFLSLTINAVEMKSYLDLEANTVNIQSILTRQYDTCEIKLFNVPNTVTIQNWQEVIITDNAQRIFAGLITKIEPTESALTYDLDYSISCVDYSKLLETVVVQATKYTSKTDAYIINDLFTDYLSEIDATTYVDELSTLTSVQFSRKTLKDALDFICGLTGADWYVDYDKKLHYFKSEDTAAPYSFSDTPDLLTTFPYYGLVKTDDGSGTFNVVEVVGGNYRSADETIYLPGTGQHNRISLPFKYQAPTGQTAVQIWRNDGTEGTPVWTPMTVKVGYIGELSGADDVLYYFQEAVIEQTAVWPSLPNAVKLTGQYEIPLRTRARNQASIDLYGREIYYVYTDSSIVDKTVARLKGNQLLIESALGKQYYSWYCQKRRLRAGMTVGMKNDAMVIDTSYLIQKVNTDIGIAGAVEVSVEAGNYNPDLVDVLLALKRASTPTMPYREDEVTDVLITDAEELELFETVGAVTTHTGTYQWDDGCKWGFAKWG